MKLNKLRSILTTHSATLSNITDQEAADYINAKNQEGRRKLIGSDIIEFLGATNGPSILKKLEDATLNSSVDVGLRTVLIWALEDLKREGIDINNASTRTIIDNLSALNIITSDEANALKALNQNQTSLAEKNELGFVRADHIQAARV